jgi:hypothetical protein
MGDSRSELLALIRKRFADVVDLADQIERMLNNIDEFEAHAEFAAADRERAHITRAWELQRVIDEEYRQEFWRLRARTIYSEFTTDEWQEIADLDATEKELARRLAERAFRNQ